MVLERVRQTVAGNDFDPMDELDLEGDLARAELELSVRMERRRYDKPVTIVSGFSGSGVDVDELASSLRKRLGTGGTVKDDRIELQGDHRDRVRELLAADGYTVR